MHSYSFKKLPSLNALNYQLRSYQGGVPWLIQHLNPLILHLSFLNGLFVLFNNVLKMAFNKQHPYIIFLFVCNLKTTMSLSSLPDIFRKTTIDPLAFRKQGSPFQLHLNSQSAEKCLHSSIKYRPQSHNYSTLPVPKRRSTSTASVRPKQASLEAENSTKPGTARDKIRVSFKDEVQFQGWSAFKRKAILSVLQTSNFPYETSRKMNNMTIDLEESDSLKNKTEYNLREIQLIIDAMNSTRTISAQTRVELHALSSNIQQDLDAFEEQFGDMLKECYNNMSKLRRHTNEGLKSNRFEVDRLEVEMNICAAFCSEISQKSEKMYADCLQTEKESLQDSNREGSPGFDFQELSTIPKESRGATGELSRRTRIGSFVRKEQLKRASWDSGVLNGGVTINGKEVEILSLQQC